MKHHNRLSNNLILILAWSHFGHAFLVSPITKPCVSFGLTILDQTSGSSLNDDGDFLIEGINDDASLSIGKTQKQASSLLDIEYNSRVSDMKDDNKSLLLMSSLSYDGNGDVVFSSSDGTRTGMDNENDESAKKSLLESLVSGNLNIDSSAAAEESGSNDLKYYNAAAADAVTTDTVVPEFLSSILSSLNSSDLNAYSMALEELGFDPDCDSSSELGFNDLAFMKPLHQRYFWREWEKLL